MEEKEGKDLAQDMRKEQEEIEKYYENVKLELSRIKLENVTIGEKHEQRQNDDGDIEEFISYGVYIDFKGESILIATIDENGKLEPNESILQDEKYNYEDRKKLGDMLNLLGLEQEEVDIDKLQEQLKDIEAKTKEELKQEKNLEEESIKDEGKEELKEKEESDKEKIAKKYNLNTNQIIHVDMNNEKITEDETFARLVKWADGKEEIYVIPGKDEYTWETIGRKKGEEEFTKIEGANKQIYGKNPNITIQRIDDEKITKIKPLAMYEIDSDTAIAIVKNEYGEPEQLYCRKQEGEQKYWGTVIPEVSKKNVTQLDFDTRSFMSSKNTSEMDLMKKEKELKKAQNLEERGVPSKEEVVKDLMNRDGIVDESRVPPGYYENKAEKVLKRLKQNQDINYKQAVEQIEKEGERKSGGRTPGETREIKS